MPDCARESTSLMSLEFLAVRSSNSLVLLISGAVCSRTYFLLEQPTLATMLAATKIISEVRFIFGGLLPLVPMLSQLLLNLGMRNNYSGYAASIPNYT